MASSRINIDFGTILKRSKCINSLSESCTDAKKRYEYLENNIHNKQSNSYIKNSLRSYIESLCDHKNANMYFRQPLYLIQEFNKSDKSCSEYILKEYTNRILPYVNDISLLNEAAQRYDLYPYQYDIIKEYASKYIIADRILNNHDKISKRFNICSEINKVKSRGLKFVTESCCSMIDTYTIAPYAKFNLCLEEMGYLLDKEGIDYDKKDLVRYTTEYFLLRSPDISDRDYKGYKTVLKENTYITEDDLEYVNFVLYPEKQSRNVLDDCVPSINKQLQLFISIQSKSIEELDKCISNCTKATILDLKTNIDKIIWLIWDVYKSNIFENAQLEQSIKCWLQCIISRFEKDIVSSSDIDNIIIKIENISNNLIAGFNDNGDYCLLISKFKELLNEFIDRLTALSDISYSKDNIDAIDYVNSDREDPIPVKEFKIFKFHNLVRATLEMDNFLKNKEKKLFISRKPNDIIFGESTDELYSYIGEDAKADICVAQYYTESSDNKSCFEEICKEFNNRLICNNMDTIRCYYVNLGEVAEIHLKESCPIKLNESDWNKIHESYNFSMDIYIDKFANVATCIESLSGFNNFDIENRLFNFKNNPNLSLEHYEVAMEALSLLDIDKDTINLFSESFGNYRYSVITESEYNRELNTIKKISENWEQQQSIPLYVQVEAFQILTAVLEDAPNVKKPEVKKPKVGVDNNKHEEDKPNKEENGKDDGKKDKNPFKGINLSSMKLYLEGLKSKMKNMSAKEKEVSRNMDNYFRLFVKSMKNALVSDRREAIIKGSVIPSFSRCVKYAIGLAGMGLITGNPLIPLLTAMTGLAVSKRLTQKERMLLLDEIETELEVVDKEISMAESKNQMKKYRQLLNYKKNLQRQYQRIRYNIRIGKDILPGSSAGIKDK